MRTHRARSYREPLRTEWLTPLLQIFFIFCLISCPCRADRQYQDHQTRGHRQTSTPPAWRPAVQAGHLPPTAVGPPWAALRLRLASCHHVRRHAKASTSSALGHHWRHNRGRRGAAEVVVPMLKSAAVIAPRPQPLTAAESMTTPAPIRSRLAAPTTSCGGRPANDVAAALIIAATGEAARTPGKR